MKKGKTSRIRYISNKSYDNYNPDGTIKTDNLSKKQLKRYLKKKELESKRRAEEDRKPRIKRNGKLL